VAAFLEKERDLSLAGVTVGDVLCFEEGAIGEDIALVVRTDAGDLPLLFFVKTG